MSEVGFDGWLHSFAVVGIWERLGSFGTIVSKLVRILVVIVQFFKLVYDEVVWCLELWRRWRRSLWHQRWCRRLSLRCDFLMRRGGCVRFHFCFDAVTKLRCLLFSDGFCERALVLYWVTEKEGAARELTHGGMPLSWPKIAPPTKPN